MGRRDFHGAPKGDPEAEFGLSLGLARSMRRTSLRHFSQCTGPLYNGFVCLFASVAVVATSALSMTTLVFGTLAVAMAAYVLFAAAGGHTLRPRAPHREVERWQDMARCVLGSGGVAGFVRLVAENKLKALLVVSVVAELGKCLTATQLVWVAIVALLVAPRCKRCC